MIGYCYYTRVGRDGVSTVNKSLNGQRMTKTQHCAVAILSWRHFLTFFIIVINAIAGYGNIGCRISILGIQKYIPYSLTFSRVSLIRK
jgi:hypothetical protein